MITRDLGFEVEFDPGALESVQAFSGLADTLAKAIADGEDAIGRLPDPSAVLELIEASRTIINEAQRLPDLLTPEALEDLPEALQVTDAWVDIATGHGLADLRQDRRLALGQRLRGLHRGLRADRRRPR